MNTFGHAVDNNWVTQSKVLEQNCMEFSLPGVYLIVRVLFSVNDTRFDASDIKWKQRKKLPRPVWIISVKSNREWLQFSRLASNCDLYIGHFSTFPVLPQSVIPKCPHQRLPARDTQCSIFRSVDFHPCRCHRNLEYIWTDGDVIRWCFADLWPSPHT